MGRQLTNSDYKCPICQESLKQDIIGELDLTDHDYGFYLRFEKAVGYLCKNNHRVILADEEEEGD